MCQFQILEVLLIQILPMSSGLSFAGILGAHMESVYFYAAGKSATLIVAGHEANETDECEKLSSCFGCAGDSKCQWDKKVQFCSRAPYGMISKDLANLGDFINHLLT